MPNAFESNPRGSSGRRLSVIGICSALVTTLVAVVMVAKSQGLLDAFVRVDVRLVNIGDGLPSRSDVKFRGVLVGAVSDLTPSQHGQPNVVHVDIKPEYAAGIPNTVTARVVPSNIFAVSAVQLVDNGDSGESLQTGDVIYEDKTLPTVLFQNVLAKLRELLAAVGRSPDPDNIGVFAALAEGTHGRGQKLTDTGRDLKAVIEQLNSVTSDDDTGTTTLSALQAGADSLRRTSPELFAALERSVTPMRTFAEKRQQLQDFTYAGLNTVSTLGDAFDNQTDRLITISTQLTPTLGILADHEDELHGVSTRFQRLANRFYDDSWDPETNLLWVDAAIAFTPTRTYTRADCPRYGELEGPSCQTAPEVPTAPDLMPGLASVGITPPQGVSENRPNVAPPRNSVRGAPAAPPPPPGTPAPPADGPLLPAEAPPPPTNPAPPEPVAPPATTYGGTVGPVGTRSERDQLSFLVGEPATTATQLLLGPLARGSIVHISAEPEGSA